jgi:hypothetical protein
LRCEASSGQSSFANAGEIESATTVATKQLNRRAKPWVWDDRLNYPAIEGGLLFTAFEEKSTRDILPPFPAAVTRRG